MGSQVLLDALLPSLKGDETVLDLGAGCGLIGIAVASVVGQAEVWMVDVDVRAVRVAQANVELNGIANARVILSDGTSDLPEGLRFDLVASNPPTHDGREVLEQLVDQSFRALKPGGSMWVVVNRMMSIKRMMEARFSNIDSVARHKGFVVLRSVRH
jgi:16S rRNA (guanine1207-N2)-methyltransferase